MSVIFGIQKSAGAAVEEPELLTFAAPTQRFAPDGTSIRTFGRVGMGLQLYQTHARSRLDVEPEVDAFGNMLVFDGRLDNYHDLGQELGLADGLASDSQIFLSAFLRWGERCFSKCVGDWAVALWSEGTQSLYLARDHAGSRTLYFQTTKDLCRWSTHLDSFLSNAAAITLDDDYVACYLACEPIGELTPYKTIVSVPPAHYVVIQNGRVRTEPHWDWSVSGRLRFSSDEEYEQMFLQLFVQSIRRRTVSGAPIMAQLSGGMDSGAIVCTSDFIRRRNNPDAEILDTISYFDESDPDWNEEPYFTAVEKKRGKSGVHFRMSFSDRTFEAASTRYGTYVLPGADSAHLADEQRLKDVYTRGGFRTILSGLGGDELLGGVPTPTPELASYLQSMDLKRLWVQTIQWCLIDRSPALSMLWDTTKWSMDLYCHPHLERAKFPPWICGPLEKRCQDHKERDIITRRRLGLSVLSICNALTWRSIMETLPHAAPGLLQRPEYRYPYLDRDLVEFLFCVPREQLVRPGRRRSLMRRTLRDIVPIEVLERKRKAFQLRTPLWTIQQAYVQLDTLLGNSLLGQYGYIDPSRLRVALSETAKGTQITRWQPLLRAIMLEIWIRTHFINRPSVAASGDLSKSALKSMSTQAPAA